MTPRLVLFILSLLTALPVTTLATDFQIEKIVDEAMAKAKAQETTPSEDVVPDTRISLQHNRTKDDRTTNPLSPLAAKAEKTDPENHKSRQD